jgi:transcriptional regulator with XRE-family HTH domain
MIATRSEQVGELVRELREARRLSVRALAAQAGFSPSFISQVENEQASPSIASLERIATALGVTLVEFFQAGFIRFH